jgi:hypothetical protein
MKNKIRYLFGLTSVLLVFLISTASATSWIGPVSQVDMGMPTATMQPGSIESTATLIPQNTPVPKVNTPGAIAASPTMTSIFTGFTPPPTGLSAGGASMGGCGTSCSTAGTSGMAGSMGMGTSITGTVGMAGMNGMGSMGGGEMGMGSCPMMSSSGMSGSGMSSMGTGDDLLMSGMDMSGSSNMIAYESSLDTPNPWMILGWVVLGLVSLAIIVAAVIGVVLLVRQLRQAPPV